MYRLLIVCVQPAPVMTGDHVDGLLGCIGIGVQDKVSAGNAVFDLVVAARVLCAQQSSDVEGHAGRETCYRNGRGRLFKSVD